MWYYFTKIHVATYIDSKISFLSVENIDIFYTFIGFFFMRVYTRLKLFKFGIELKYEYACNRLFLFSNDYAPCFVPVLEYFCLIEFLKTLYLISHCSLLSPSPAFVSISLLYFKASTLACGKSVSLLPLELYPKIQYDLLPSMKTHQLHTWLPRARLRLASMANLTLVWPLPWYRLANHHR